MTTHDHTEIVQGCYRCELSANEVDPRFDVTPEQAYGRKRAQREAMHLTEDTTD